MSLSTSILHCFLWSGTTFLRAKPYVTFIFPDDFAAKRLNLTWYLYFSEVHLPRWGFLWQMAASGQQGKMALPRNLRMKTVSLTFLIIFCFRGLDEFYFSSSFLSRWVLTRWVFWDCEVWLFMELLGNFVYSVWFCVRDLFLFFFRKEDWFICYCGFWKLFTKRFLLKYSNSIDLWNEIWNIRNQFLTCGGILKYTKLVSCIVHATNNWFIWYRD